MATTCTEPELMKEVSKNRTGCIGRSSNQNHDLQNEQTVHLSTLRWTLPADPSASEVLRRVSAPSEVLDLNKGTNG